MDDRPFSFLQAVEKRDLLCCASSCLPVRPTQTGVLAAYRLYASFLRIRPPCISWMFTGLPAIRCINRLLGNRRGEASTMSNGILKVAFSRRQPADSPDPNSLRSQVSQMSSVRDSAMPVYVRGFLADANALDGTSSSRRRRDSSRSNA